MYLHVHKYFLSSLLVEYTFEYFHDTPGPEVIKEISCSTQLGMKILPAIGKKHEHKISSACSNDNLWLILTFYGKVKFAYRYFIWEEFMELVKKILVQKLINTVKEMSQ